MKGLAIKGKIFVKEVEYKVLFSDILKDFVTMPISTQVAMIDDMSYNTCKANIESISLSDLFSIKSSLELTLRALDASIELKQTKQADNA
jgi:hypothetical protein